MQFAEAPSTRQLAWALCRLDIESRPDFYGLRDLVDFAMREDAEIDAIATERCFLFEAQANHIRHWLTKTPYDRPLTGRRADSIIVDDMIDWNKVDWNKVLDRSEAHAHLTPEEWRQQYLCHWDPAADGPEDTRL